MEANDFNKYTSKISKDITIVGNIIVNDNFLVAGKINGNINCKGDLLINGKVEGNVSASSITLVDTSINGNIQCEKNLNILGDSYVMGDVTTTNALIEGKIDGDILAQGKIAFKNTAALKGNCSAHLLSTEEDTKITGYIKILTSNEH